MVVKPEEAWALIEEIYRAREIEARPDIRHPRLQMLVFAGTCRASPA